MEATSYYQPFTCFASYNICELYQILPIGMLQVEVPIRRNKAQKIQKHLAELERKESDIKNNNNKFFFLKKATLSATKYEIC